MYDGRISTGFLFSPLIVLISLGGPFCVFLFDPVHVSSFGWASLDCGFTREEGVGRGRGGISENGEEEVGIGGGGNFGENGEEEEGIGGGGNLGAGGIIPAVGSIGGMADAILLGEESVEEVVLEREEREGEGEMSKPNPPTLLKLVSEHNRLGQEGNL